MKKYPKYFLPESAGNMCALTCVYGVFNYFWHTSFNWKDNWEMMQLMKGGKYTGSEILDIPEIAYKLDKLGFKINVYYSYEESLHKKFLDNPKEIYPLLVDKKYHSFINNGMRTEPGNEKGYDFTDTSLIKAIYNNDSIEKHFESSLEQVLRDETDESVLYIVGINYDILHEIEHEEGIAGGHVVLVEKIIGNDYIVHDPGPPLIQYGKFNKKLFHASLLDMGDYEFVRVTQKK